MDVTQQETAYLPQDKKFPPCHVQIESLELEEYVVGSQWWSFNNSSKEILDPNPDKLLELFIPKLGQTPSLAK